MLLRRTVEGWLAITQPAHAWLSGELATAWGGADFSVPEPVDAVVRAAALHDIGWLDWERAPRRDPATGLPLTFAKVPAEEHTRLWRRGVDHAAAFGAYVALLVSRHGDSIYERTFDPAIARPEAAAAVRAFLDEQHALQAEIVTRLAGDAAMGTAVSGSHLALTKRFIVALDTLSLALCWSIEDETAIDDVPDRNGEPRRLRLIASGDETVVDPWPFRTDTLELFIEGRRLGAGCMDQAALEDALAAAAITRQPIRLRPLAV